MVAIELQDENRSDSVIVAKGCKLTVTDPVDLKLIFDFLNITVF
jgi:hypothetical protein